MTETAGSRAAGKERTRRAILDATLELCADSPLAALSLRQVAKQVGIVPTAFYRHFDSIDQLGLALVEESFGSLRDLLRDIRNTTDPDFGNLIDASLAAVVEHVHRRRDHFSFIGRERFAGPAVVREAVDRTLERFVDELATDLSVLPGLRAWSSRHLRALADLIVTAFVALAERLVSTTPGSATESELIETARTQIRMLIIGARQWDASR